MLYKSRMEARDGAAIPVFTDGRTMFSRYAPLREAENFASTVASSHGTLNPSQQDGFFVVCGLGSGLHIRALRKRFPASSILVIEGSQEDIQWLENNFDLKDLLSDPGVWIASCRQATETFVRLYNPLLHGNFFFLPLRSWMDQMQEEAVGIKNGIEGALQDIASDFSTQAYFGRVWFRNFFLNLGILPYVRLVHQLPQARSYSRALVAAAGPSLDRIVPDLQRQSLRKALYLIATDTALPVLLRHGIHPDMTVTIDGQLSSAQHFLRKLPCSMILAAEITSSPAVIRRCHESHCPVLFFRNNNPLSSLFQSYLSSQGEPGLPAIHTGAGTVAMAAVDMARFLGFTTIQISGGDFAYIDGKPYCRGTYFEDRFANDAVRTKTLDQKYVELMFSRKTFREHDKIITQVLEGYGRSFRQYMQTHNEINFITGQRPPEPTQKKEEPSSTKRQGGGQRIPQIGEELVKGFVDWYKHLLQQENQEIISSILPLYGWHSKKNNNKYDIFHIMKLAHSLTVRYTVLYGK